MIPGIFVILLLNQHISIHQIEYYKYLHDAVFSPVSSIKLDYVPLRPIARGMLKNYYGYLPYWIDTTYYGFFQMELLTHIAYFSVEINPSDGSLGSIPNQNRFIKIRDYAHERGVRIHMTFIIFGSANVSTFLNNIAARQNAINNINNFITNYGIEGANIDFEFVTSSVRDSFNLYIRDLSNRLHGQTREWKELYTASIAVPEWYPGYDLGYLAQYLDGFFIMTYDFHWSGSSVAGPVSPCVPSAFWGQYCAAKSIGSYRADGVDASKIVLGLPYYGYDWPTVSGDMGSATTGTGSAVIYYYAFQNANTHGRIWDSNSLTPWYRYSTTEWHQCWYDDSASHDIKYSMVNDSLLQGAGCWALGYDRNYDHLWNTVKRNFWVEPPTRHFTAEVMQNMEIRDGPGIDYNILAMADSGSKFVAYDYLDLWYKIYFPSQFGTYYGWAWGGEHGLQRYMRGTTQNTVLRVTTNLLNIREGPDISYPIITQTACGQVFVADSFSGNWARIHLPIINGYTRGWLYYNGYTNVIQDLEDHNVYDYQLVMCNYSSVVEPLEEFTVYFIAVNTGFGPWDTLVYFKAAEPSPFYNPNTWRDSTRARLSTDADGLPNQRFFFTTLFFRAPYVTDSTVVTDTFRFERKDSLFGQAIAISVLVRPLSVNEEAGLLAKCFRIPKTIFSHELEVILIEGISYEIEIFDVIGRRLINKKSRGQNIVSIGRELTPGVYFLVVKSGTNFLRTKIVKIRR